MCNCGAKYRSPTVTQQGGTPPSQRRGYATLIPLGQKKPTPQSAPTPSQEKADTPPVVESPAPNQSI